MRMLTALAFIPEIDVIDCFIILRSQFPPIAMEIAEYFEINYIGRRLPDQSRMTLPYPIRIWNMYVAVLSRSARTNNAVDEWHNSFKSGINCPHPSFTKLFSHLQKCPPFANIFHMETNVIKLINS